MSLFQTILSQAYLDRPTAFNWKGKWLRIILLKWPIKVDYISRCDKFANIFGDNSKLLRAFHEVFMEKFRRSFYENGILNFPQWNCWGMKHVKNVRARKFIIRRDNKSWRQQITPEHCTSFAGRTWSKQTTQNYAKSFSRAAMMLMKLSWTFLWFKE